MSENDIPPLSCEARLIDYISANLNTISRNIEQFASSGSSGFDKVSGAAKGTGNAVTDLGSKIENNLLRSVTSLATGFVGLAGAMKAYSMLKEGYELAKKGQEAQVQLTAALGYYSAALDNEATKLSKDHTIKREDIATAQERLANYVKEESAIDALIPAVMNLAAAKGLNLATAADLVGRAIGSNEKMIGRYGITLTGAAGSMEKVQSAIDGLNAKFKGQQDALDTTKTFWDKLGLSIHDATENMGKVFTAQTSIDKYKEYKNILAQQNSGMDTMMSPAMLDQMRSFVADFEKKNLENQRNASFGNIMGGNIGDVKANLEETANLREAYLKTSLEGQLTLLREEMASEIEAHKGHEDQIKLIRLRYAQEIADKIKEINAKGGDIGRNENTGLKGGITGVGATTTANAAATSMTMMNEGQEFLKSMSPAQTDDQMEAAHQKYLAFEEAMRDRHQSIMQSSLYEQIESTKALLDANQAYYDKAQLSEEEYLKNKTLLVEKEQMLQEKEVEASIKIGEEMGNAMGSGFEKGKFSAKKAMKEMLDLLVDYLDKQALAAIASNTLQNVAEEGFWGLIVGAAEAAGIEVIASAAKAGINSFAVGTRDAPGGLAYVHKDELINLPAHSQVYTANETKNMIGGDTHFHFYGNTDSTTKDNIETMLLDANRSGKLNRFKQALTQD